MVDNKINVNKVKLTSWSLIDHDVYNAMVQRKSLPKDKETFLYQYMKVYATYGTFQASQHVYLSGIKQKKLSYTRQMKYIKTYVFDYPKAVYGLYTLTRILKNRTLMMILKK